MKNINTESNFVLNAMYDISIAEKTLMTEQVAEDIATRLPNYTPEEVGLLLEYLADKGYLSVRASNGANTGYYNLTAAGVDKIETKN